ncbi:MAG: DUF2844 domain-containing protein [Burkholderiales bacterium]
MGLATLAPDAHAALGDNESSIATDAAVTKMQLRPAGAAAIRYRLYEMRDAARGVQVREYADSQSGLIFGVTWSGRVKPDLKQVLGSYYFERYVDAARGSGKVRGMRQVNQPDFVLRVSGHMRHFVGAAWIPALLPAGVDPAEVR